ncbi:hypothetical protein BFX12_17810 [Vibrio cholerae]|nr:hypothetical protein BFX12_17810 [Vibrio cholerae]
MLLDEEASVIGVSSSFVGWIILSLDEMDILSNELATSSGDELAGGGCGLGSTSEFIEKNVE